MKGQPQIRLGSIDILFEDNHYIAVNKKSGWVVHQTLDPNRSNLFDALKSFIKQRDKLTDDGYLTLQHRLDVDTSGIVLFGKSKESNKVLSHLFSNRGAIKKYHAICYRESNDLPEQGLFEDFLKKQKVGKIEKMMAVKSGGQKTLTKYHVQENAEQLYLIEFELVTGRMHQIRVQSALRNFPILGDPLYGNKNLNRKYNIEGQLLHAASFRFFDPLSNKEIFIEAPTPFSLEKLTGKSGEDKNKEKKYIIFNKPYNVLCQFSKEKDSELALCDFSLPKDIYPAGRLDKDSEGLLFLTNDGPLINKISSPDYHKVKTYWAQVENIPSEEAIKELASGVIIKGGYKTKPCRVKLLSDLKIEEREPPIRQRKNIPTCWLEIQITEGKNRQVRRMTAAIGHPTLRLIRVSIGKMNLPVDLKSGEYRAISSIDI